MELVLEILAVLVGLLLFNGLVRMSLNKDIHEGRDLDRLYREWERRDS